MITVPVFQSNKWEVKCYGKLPVFMKDLTKQIAFFVLSNCKVKKKDLFIEFVFHDEKKMKECSFEYLDKDYATDTISLPFADIKTNTDAVTFLGCCILCWPVIKKAAAEESKNELHHFAHIVVHSVLHLLGYDHEEDEDRKSMRAKEIIILSKLGVFNPYLNYPKTEKKDDYLD